MRKIIILFLFLITRLPVSAQYAYDFGIQAGVSNYLGEIGGKDGPGKSFIYDLTLAKSQFTVGGFARYRLLPMVSLKLGLNWLRLEAADNASTNPGRVGRNLSFRNDLIESELTAQIFFYQQPDLGHNFEYDNDFKMYAFGGLGAFYSNPKAYYNNSWVALQPLRTEGIAYKKYNLSVPLGLGMFITLHKKHRIGWEIEYRKTFTDYIDDISGRYPDPSELNSPLAIALSNRRGELGDTPGVPAAANYGPGDKRGNPANNDSYLSTSFYYSYVIRGRSNFYKAKFGSLFKHKGGKKRKIRAKF